jgi:hypothetical protein
MKITSRTSIPVDEGSEKICPPPIQISGYATDNDLVMCYKIVFGLIDLEFNDFFTFSPSGVTRGHEFKLYKTRAKGARNSFFTTRVINVWNGISPDTVEFYSLCTFKRTIKLDDFSLFLKAAMSQYLTSDIYMCNIVCSVFTVSFFFLFLIVCLKGNFKCISYTWLSSSLYIQLMFHRFIVCFMSK